MYYEKPYLILRTSIDIRCLIGYFEKKTRGEVSVALGLFSRMCIPGELKDMAVICRQHYI